MVLQAVDVGEGGGASNWFVQGWLECALLHFALSVMGWSASGGLQVSRFYVGASHGLVPSFLDCAGVVVCLEALLHLIIVFLLDEGFL